MTDPGEKVYTFYSQQGEDIFAYKHFLNQVVNDGVFVEVGALDGVSGSNTKFFEDNLGYTGLLIEPQRDLAQAILRARTKSTLFPCAIHPTENSIRFLGCKAAAGILESMSADHKAQWFPDEKTAQVMEVPAFRLGDILKLSNIVHIDFLSIDVEGGELGVLESIDWEDIEIYLICIELDGTAPEKDAACRLLLQKAGFTFQTYIGNNDLWVNLDYSKRGSRKGEIPPYSGQFDYLNAESMRNLPHLLSSFVPPANRA